VLLADVHAVSEDGLGGDQTVVLVDPEIISAVEKGFDEIHFLRVFAQVRVNVNSGVLAGKLPRELQLEIGGGRGEARRDGVSAGRG
jgi:hypothetical protein